MNEHTRTNTDHSNIGASVKVKDRMTKSAHQGIDAVSDAAHPTIDRAASGAHRAVESADDMVNHAAEAIDKAVVKGEELVAASTTYMRDHPLLTLSIAVGAGYLLSRLLASR